MSETVGSIASAIRIERLSKSFGATRALKSVSMQVPVGTIHALVGENGAGKSTALGILAGRTSPTSGRVEVFGEKARYGDPRAARRAGVVAIYQELTIVPSLSAEANVFLAEPIKQAGFLKKREMRSRYEALCERAGVKAVPANTPAGSLSVADQQILEILRALVSNARVILFDEPTASLAVPERQALFRLISTLRGNGVTVIFVSHNLDEVLEIADAITVFRDGKLEVSEARENFTKPVLVRAMIGSKGDDRLVAEMLESDGAVHPEGPTRSPSAVTRRARRAGQPPILRAQGISVPGAIDGVDIEVHAGEIVGIGGLVGSGRTTLLRSLAGLEPTSTGRLWLDGREVDWPRSVRRALKYGIALIPEDRKTQGLVLTMSAMDNIALSDFTRTARLGLVSERRIEHATADVAQKFGFQPDRLGQRASQISGGNQQKLLLARWKHVTPRILLADEPTRGIDVGAKAEILRSLESMADEGLGLVIASSELEEVVAVAERVLVLAEGVPVGTLDGSESDITVSQILDHAFKVRSALRPVIRQPDLSPKMETRSSS
jgi:ABC-type sugar transport system ATPase subunit